MKEKIKVNFRPGMVVKIDEWGPLASHLQLKSAWDEEFFGNRVHFRLPSPSFKQECPAIRIEQSGRTIQYTTFNQKTMRVKVTWVEDDGENEQFAYGIVFISNDDYVIE
jgi:hypothetical protein